MWKSVKKIFILGHAIVTFAVPPYHIHREKTGWVDWRRIISNCYEPIGVPYDIIRNHPPSSKFWIFQGIGIFFKLKISFILEEFYFTFERTRICGGIQNIVSIAEATIIGAWSQTRIAGVMANIATISIIIDIKTRFASYCVSGWVLRCELG